MSKIVKHDKRQLCLIVHQGTTKPQHEKNDNNNEWGWGLHVTVPGCGGTSPPQSEIKAGGKVQKFREVVVLFQPFGQYLLAYSRVFNKHPGHSNFSQGLWSAQDRFLESPHLFKKNFSVQDNFIKSLPNYHISKLSRQDKTKTVFTSFVIIYSEVFFSKCTFKYFFHHLRRVFNQDLYTEQLSKTFIVVYQDSFHYPRLFQSTGHLLKPKMFSKKIYNISPGHLLQPLLSRTFIFLRNVQLKDSY